MIAADRKIKRIQQNKVEKHWVNIWLVTGSLDFILFIAVLFNNSSESLWGSVSILAHRNFMKAGSFSSTLSRASSNLVNLFSICLFFFLFLLKLVRATIKPIALRYSFYQTLGCFFSVCLILSFLLWIAAPGYQQNTTRQVAITLI